MAFGLLQKRPPQPVAPVAEPQPAAPTVAGAVPAPDGDSAREILELLEPVLGGRMRQLERAANKVAGGAAGSQVRVQALSHHRSRQP